MATKEYSSASLIAALPEEVKFMDAARTGTDKKSPLDISLADFVKGKYELSLDSYMDKLGINTKVDTMNNLFTIPDQSIRWLIPEIIRAAVSLGLRQSPIYPSLIQADQPVAGLQVTMPYINMSDATPSKLNEAETIPLGTISYGSKQVNLFKIGKGIKITDEVKNYVSLDVLSVYLRDFGIQLGYSLDTLAMDVLINGNATDGSESAPVIGVDSTTNGITYKDMLRLWIRASRLGRNFSTMIGDEDQSIAILNLDEFKKREYGTTMATLNVQTPVPNSANYYIHPGVPSDEVLFLDKSAAMIKLTSKSLVMESERIVSNQTNAIYASLTTGFCKMYQDASILLKSDVLFSANSFPTWMDVDPYLSVSLR